jgi:hypothetical protein
MGIIPSNRFDETTKIYRTISKERLFEIFAKHQNALVRPRLWPDPYENFMLSSQVDVNGEIGEFEFKHDVYGQCWTLTGFSDAMWRIYSKGTNGVRIRTTVGKLLKSLSSQIVRHKEFSSFIGKVNYKSEFKIREFASNHFSRGIKTDGTQIAETLLVKRQAFIHEKEVRLIYHSIEKTEPSHDIFCYNLKPHELIDQIMLHPLLDIEGVVALKNEIKSKTGYQGRLTQSNLYKLPKAPLIVKWSE